MNMSFQDFNFVEDICEDGGFCFAEKCLVSNMDTLLDEIDNSVLYESSGTLGDKTKSIIRKMVDAIKAFFKSIFDKTKRMFDSMQAKSVDNPQEKVEIIKNPVKIDKVLSEETSWVKSMISKIKSDDSTDIEDIIEKRKMSTAKKIGIIGAVVVSVGTAIQVVKQMNSKRYIYEDLKLVSDSEFAKMDDKKASKTAKILHYYSWAIKMVGKDVTDTCSDILKKVRGKNTSGNNLEEDRHYLTTDEYNSIIEKNKLIDEYTKNISRIKDKLKNWDGITEKSKLERDISRYEYRISELKDEVSQISRPRL